MTTALSDKNPTKNHLATYKEWCGGGVLETPILGGAGDAALSPCVTCGHTPALALGAVLVPDDAPGADKVLRLMLTPEQSTALTAAGESAFAVVGKCSHPTDPRLWELFLVPCSVSAGDSAVRVATGLSAERRPRPVKPPTSTTDPA